MNCVSPDPKLCIEFGSLPYEASLPYVVVRQGMMIMPGVPSSSSATTAAINAVIAAGTTHDNRDCDLVLRR